MFHFAAMTRADNPIRVKHRGEDVRVGAAQDESTPRRVAQVGLLACKPRQ
jgi:hypothetical protein